MKTLAEETLSIKPSTIRVFISLPRMVMNGASGEHVLIPALAKIFTDKVGNDVLLNICGILAQLCTEFRL